MKKSKIKPKYLKKTQISLENTPPTYNSNFFDKAEKIILKSLLCFGLILLLLTWGFISVIIPALFGLDYTTLSETNKYIFMTISNIILIIILFSIYKKSIINDFKNFFNHNLKENFKISLRYWIIGVLIMIFSNQIISIVNNGKIAVNEESVQTLIKTAPLYTAFELLIFAPITEEIVFRRSVRDIINNSYIYSIISGLIFGSLHAISSLNSLIDLLYFIPYCSMGFTFALLYSKTNNIFSTITIHAFHNSITLLLFLLQA